MTEPPAPIETVYRGIRLRSRLEARWLVWLDYLGVPWQYEPRVFTFDGWRYLPDAYLPEQAVYLEIKPAGHEPEDALYTEFVAHAGRDLVLVAGEPWPERYTCTFYHRKARVSGIGYRVSERPSESAPADTRYPIPDTRCVSRDLVWAVGRRDHAELWLFGDAGGYRLNRRVETCDPPLTRCSLLRQAYWHASTWEFGEGE